MCADGGGIPRPEEPSIAAELVDAVRRAKGGEASPQDVFEAFLQARLYCERPEEPGFLTVPVPAGSDDAPPRSRLLDLIDGSSEEADPPVRLVPVFSSLEQFALFVGEGAWFSTTGADVLNLLPPGVDVWLDPAAEHTMRLASSATKVEQVLHISYRDRGRSA
ncbi:SseB family protein [Streptomyces sp. PSKA30]|uniref:SseB family protein n=1 Tax=Streptomyces sp. PSKA30 TaxID=2874597 RepID=UPI001CD08143|nr:SseB family protein [Streptomyces sp. PSKA30]MBZ9639857.1 SseB family protein [Streptomyces sp. PSKA30]